MMEATQLQQPTLPQVSERIAKDAGETEANFLALRLLNKRARVRLSPEQLDLDPLPGQARLFAVANSKGCFIAVARDTSSTWYLTSAPLSQLRSTFTSSTQSGEIAFVSQSKHPLPTPATFIAYALHESRVVVALADGSLAVYDAQSLLSNSPARPLHLFPGSPGTTFRKLSPNPGDMAELVAVLRDVGDRTDVVAVEVFDIQNMRSVCGWRAGATPNTKPTAFSWSAKGKLLALGLASGDIEAFSPAAPSAVKAVVPKVQGLSEGTIISTSWLSNTEFYSVYTPPGPPSPDAEHTHYVTQFDPKTNLFAEVKVNPPALPFPGLRAPNQFVVLFRSWDTARILAFVGDSASSDIGALAAIGEIGTTLHNHWTNLSLEETSQPTVPLDKDMNDTVLIGLEGDLTGTEPFRFTTASGEETDVPAPPVLYAYASDGTLVGWQVVNTKGVAYPGMVTPSSVPAPTPAGGGMDAEPTTTAVATPAATVQAPPMEISTSFGATSPAAASPMAATPSGGGTSSGFGFGGFAGGASKFGQSGFGGFGGGGGGSTATSTTPSAPAMASPMPSQRPPSPEEASMDSDNDAGTGGGFGGLSLGGGNEDANKNKTSSVFGSFSAPSTSASQPSSAFGSSSGGAFSGLKPATGFGAFGGQGSGAFGGSSAFSSTPTTSPPSASGGAFSGLKPASGFGAFGGQGSGAFGGSAFGQTSTLGQSAFGQTSTPAQSTSSQTSTPGQSAFGQSAFGQSASGQSAFGQSAFGHSAFGKSAFGQSSFGQPAAGPTQSAPATGGFGAFAQAVPTGFGATQAKQDAKPSWAAATESKSPSATEVEAKPAAPAFGQSSFGQPALSASQSSTTPSTGFGAFAQTGTGAFGTAQPKVDAKPAWASTAETKAPAATEAPKAENKPATPAFGQTGFGQPAFGQSAFGQPSAFGAASKPATPAASAFGAFSQAGTGAFGTAAAQADAKSAWAGKTENGPATPKEEAKPVVAPPTPPSASFTPTRVQPTPTMNPKQTPPRASRASSRSSSPSSTAVSSTSDSDSDSDTPGATTPQATTPSAESPARPAGGAFSQLKTSAYGFGKVDSGFGAFGGVSNASSPFFKAAAKPVETPATPAFAASTSAFGASTTTVAAGSTTPAFGAPSALGAKSVFGASPPTPAAGSSTPVFGATSAFGAKSVFGQPASPSQKSTTATTTTPVTPPAGGGFAAFSNNKSPFGTASGGGKSFSDMLRDKSGQVLIAPAHTPDEKPVSAFANLPKLSDTGKGKEASDDDDDALSFGDEDEDGADFLSDSEEDSDVEDGEHGGDADKTVQAGNADEEEEEEEEEEEDDEEEDEDEDEEEEDEDEEGATDPAALKAKADAESTKLPSLLSRLGPAVTAEQKSAPAVSIKREGSTTPPGSPAATKAATAPPASNASLAPPPVLSVTGPAVGSTRGTTRPIRSSPLASKPITGDDSGSDSGQSPPTTPPSNAKGKQRVEQGVQESRPKTPPLLSAIKAAPAPAVPPFSLGSAKPGEPTSSNVVSLKPPQTLPPFTFSKPGSPVPTPTIPTVTPPKPGAFTLSPAQTTPTPKPVGPGQSGATSTTPTGTPPTARQSTTPKGTPPVTGARLALVPPIPPEKFPETKDMQTECEFLVTYLAGEFTKLLPLTQLAAKRRVEMYKTGLNMTDINKPEGWRISDLPRIEQLMRDAEKDLAEVKQLFQSYMSAITDIESQLLKANTRKEEIVRFNKASKDPEFARMLKARTLGPEHLEAQSQLRREIRAVRERLQQLEGHMQEAKKKLSHMKTGKAIIRPPSLALINGTCNHLEEAIEQNEDVIEELSKRTARLSLELAPRRSKWDQRTLDDDAKQRAEATPNFAVSTAAALNAEMSANKLKRALLAARKEPMLNTEAAKKMPASQDYVVPVPVKEEPQTPPQLTLTGSPDNSFSPSSDDYSLHGQRRAKGGKFHQPPIHLKKSVSPTPPPASLFNWGPLPNVAPPAPTSALPFDLKKSMSPAPNSSTPPSLSASWVTEGFNIKKEGP